MMRKRRKSPKPPPNPWPEIAGTAKKAEKIKMYQDALFDAWENAGKSITDSVFIARTVISALEPAGDQPPQRTDDKRVEINNRMRPFVFSTNALARWLELI